MPESTSTINELYVFVNRILIERGRTPIQQLELSMSLRRDLAFESLDLAALTVLVEDRFNVDIFEDGVVDTVDEILDRIHHTS